MPARGILSPMLFLASGLFGLIVGSYLNVVVLRHGAGSLGGRSRCMSCTSQIAWYDNIPLLSWILLRGRCRSCRSAISIQYPIVEALSGVVFALIVPKLISTTALFDVRDLIVLFLDAVIIALLIAVAVYDARHTMIPDAWVYSFSVLALVVALLTSPAPFVMTLLSGPAAAAPLFALWLVSRGAWMGFGDVKMAVGIGWFLGPLFGIFAVFLAFVVGALVSVCILLPMPYLMRRLHAWGIARLSTSATHFTMKSEVAFGPFLVAAFFITWLTLLYRIPLPL